MADTLSTVNPSGNTLPFPALQPAQTPQSSGSASLPANPSDSPYTPLDLPQASPPPSPLPERQQPGPNQLGAVSKGGAAAYLVDQGLRGIVEGRQKAQAFHAEQFNRKMAGLSEIAKEVGNRYKQAYSEVGSEHPDWSPQQINADPRVAKMKAQVDANFEATQGSLQKYLGLKVDKKTGQVEMPKKGNFMERMFGENRDPDDAILAFYQARSGIGPGVYHALPTPAQLQAMNQQRKTEATTAQTAQTSAETASVTEGMKNELANLQAKQNPTDADKARIDHLRDALSNIGKGVLTPIDKVPFKNSMTGQYEQRFMDRETNQVVTEPVPGYTPVVSGKPRVQWFKDAHGKVGSVQMGADNQPDWRTANYDTIPPAGIVNMFGHKEHTTNTAFTDANGNRHEVELMNESHSVIPSGVIPTANETPTAPPPTPPKQVAGAVTDANPVQSESSSLPPQPKNALNQYANPEDQPPEVSYRFNKQWAKPGSYSTKLDPQREQQFREWAAKNPRFVQGEVGSGPDFSPLTTADYDVRGHWLAAQHGDPRASLVPNKWDGKLHGNDAWKTPYSGSFSRESIYATPNAPRWVGDRLETADGRLITDETPRKQSHPSTLHKESPAETKAHPVAHPTAGNGVMRDTIIGNVGSVAEKDLTKKADNAEGAFASVSEMYNEARANMNTALADPQNGVAKMNIVASFLKSMGLKVDSQAGGSQIRMTIAEWNQAIKSAPVLERMFSHVDVRNGFTLLSGVTLSSQQMRNFVGAIGVKAVEMGKAKEQLRKRAHDQLAADIAAGKSGTNQSTKSQSSAIDDEILNLVK